MARCKTVVIGFLGSVLDGGMGPERWDRWRPTVDLCRHEDFLVDRLDLLTQKKFNHILDRVTQDIAGISPETQVVPHLCELKDPWDFEEVYGALHDFAAGYDFRMAEDDYYIHITTGTHVAQICLFLLTESGRLPGRLLQTMPPPGHRRSAPGGLSVIDLDLSKYDRIAGRFEQEKKDSLTFLKGGISTRNRAFNDMIAEIEHISISSSAPILLMGPTGAGKSQLARRIFELKKSRRQITGEFVELNCATLRGDSAMSALFGHVKGAFTGASTSRDGLLRRANGGLLLLDEIGELGLDEQSMLLRALEDKRFLPVGADTESSSNFQLIAGTNRDLQRAVQDGLFREDLLARINLWTFHLPALRDRPEDIEPNIAFELEAISRRINKKLAFSREAYETYLAFARSDRGLWRSNFRDLNASITRMGTLAEGGRITGTLVSREIERLERLWVRPEGATTQPATFADLPPQHPCGELDLFDRMQLASVLEVCRDSRSLSEAGRKLFSSSRNRKRSVNDADRLRKYLLRHGLTWETIGGAYRAPAGGE